MGHVSALEPTTEVGVVQSRRTRASAGSLLSGEVGSSAEGHVVVPDPFWMPRGVRNLWAHGSTRALLVWRGVVWSL
jgi:hypothetical protein